MQALVFLWPLSLVFWVPAGFAASYLGSQARTADLAWFALSIVAAVAGAGLAWFGFQFDESLEEDSRATWATIAGFLIGGLGLGALSGFLARALGTLGWIIGYTACALSLLFAVYAVLGSVAL